MHKQIVNAPVLQHPCGSLRKPVRGDEERELGGSEGAPRRVVHEEDTHLMSRSRFSRCDRTVLTVQLEVVDKLVPEGQGTADVFGVVVPVKDVDVVRDDGGVLARRNVSLRKLDVVWHSVPVIHRVVGEYHRGYHEND